MGTKTVNKEILVLGGGLSGLAVSHYLKGKCTILEANDVPGGLCRSFQKDGFFYDIGGHIMFSKNKSVLNEMVSWLGDNVHKRYRINHIWFKDRFVKYPFENGLSVLEKQDIYECLISFLNRPKDIAPDNLEDWLICRFGEGISKKYLIPYNKKIWKRDTNVLATDWVERIPSPPTEDIVKSAIGIETEGYKHQLHFYYPKQGGINSLIHSLSDHAPGLKTGFKVTSVKKKGSEWEISNGAETFYSETLISTIPVFELFAALENVPQKVKKALDNLQYNSLVLGMVGVNHEGMKERAAAYIPDPEILPHRVCFMKYFTDNNAPEGKSNIIAEITVPPDDNLLKTDNEVILEKIVDGVKDICGFSKNEIIATDMKKLKYTYVIYDMDYNKNVNTVLGYLKSLGIYYTGRFGSFQYINMDRCVEMAKELVQANFSGEKNENE